MSVQWYYIDQGQATVGPVSQEVLAKEYAQGKVNDNSYVWNGTTVNEWKFISAVPGLSDNLKPKPKPKPAVVKPKPAPVKPKTVAPEQKSQSAKPSPAAGGADAERNNLLAAIRAGKKLKRKPKKETVKKKPVAQMSLAEQMKVKLSKRNQNQPARISKTKSNSLTKARPKKSSEKRGSKGARGGGKSAGALPYKLKNKVAYIRESLEKLSPEDEWKILAIEKILY